MAGLTTHVLDTSAGCPAAGLKLSLWRVDDDGTHSFVTDGKTNDDGRLDGPLLPAARVQPGTYEIVFHVGDYFRGRGVTLTDPAFLDEVPVRFGIADATAHYHVPLLVSPYGYSTYRGS